MLIVEKGEGANNSTAWADVEEYFGFRDTYLFEKDCVDPDEREIKRALNTAARMLSDRIRWSGCKRRSKQFLAWPRVDAQNCCENTCVSCCEIPRQIVEANIILAHQLLKGEITPFTNETSAKVSAMSLDKYSVQFTGGAHIKQTDACGGVMTMSADPFSAVRHLVRCYQTRGNSIRIRRS